MKFLTWTATGLLNTPQKIWNLVMDSKYARHIRPENFAPIWNFGKVGCFRFHSFKCHETRKGRKKIQNSQLFSLILSSTRDVQSDYLSATVEIYQSFVYLLLFDGQISTFLCFSFLFGESPMLGPGSNLLLCGRGCLHTCMSCVCLPFALIYCNMAKPGFIEKWGASFKGEKKSYIQASGCKGSSVPMCSIGILIFPALQYICAEYIIWPLGHMHVSRFNHICLIQFAL